MDISLKYMRLATGIKVFIIPAGTQPNLALKVYLCILNPCKIDVIDVTDIISGDLCMTFDSNR